MTTSTASRAAIFCLMLPLLAGTLACKRSEHSASPVKRYPFKGRVISIDKNARTLNVDNQPIPGFMDSMIMSYAIKPDSTLARLQPGDLIAADLVAASEEYWLENVTVTGHSAAPSPAPPAGPSGSIHIPSPGDDVPDFKLVNQSGRTISLQQYRGQTLLLTLVYTRCPFPNYRPRVSHSFAEIAQQLRSDPARYGGTHLLSVSFDPAHDTPRVLREYAFSTAGSKDPSLFSLWEFAAVPAAQLPAFADYFALTYKEEGGLITHSLSTAVISPSGKVFKWYHGADWSAGDLLADIAAAKAS